MCPEVNLPPFDKECINVSSKSKIKVFCDEFLASRGRGGPVFRGYFVNRKVDAFEGEVGDFMDAAFDGFDDFSEFSLNSRIRIDFRGVISSAPESPLLTGRARIWWVCEVSAVELETEEAPSSADFPMKAFLIVVDNRRFFGGGTTGGGDGGAVCSARG